MNRHPREVSVRPWYPRPARRGGHGDRVRHFIAIVLPRIVLRHVKRHYITVQVFTFVGGAMAAVVAVLVCLGRELQGKILGLIGSILACANVLGLVGVGIVQSVNFAEKGLQKKENATVTNPQIA